MNILTTRTIQRIIAKNIKTNTNHALIEIDRQNNEPIGSIPFRAFSRFYRQNPMTLTIRTCQLARCHCIGCQTDNDLNGQLLSTVIQLKTVNWSSC